jgi:hypothetical protein
MSTPAILAGELAVLISTYAGLTHIFNRAWYRRRDREWNEHVDKAFGILDSSDDKPRSDLDSEIFDALHHDTTVEECNICQRGKRGTNHAR